MHSCKNNFVSNIHKFCGLILDQANLPAHQINILIPVEDFPSHLCIGFGVQHWGPNAVKSSSGDNVIVQCGKKFVELIYWKKTVFSWYPMEVELNQSVKDAVLISLPPGTRCD